MKKVLALVAMVLLPSGSALAGDGYDRCVREEKVLRAEVVDSCSGVRYLFNPSGCFAAQKAVKEYDNDRCKKIGEAEKVTAPSPPATAATPEKKAGAGADPAQAESKPAVPRQESDVEQLKAENAQLKVEIARLKAEIAQLKSCTAQ
ncbi:septum formation initiator family protein [Geobacter sp. AOG1]|uniref:FtsB family cell division protein n=1 Tax=Geobacter sp. AOG1 TaxID=1566346 RepID=UPI001CC5DACD|nr:hypothetical protein [Geobacter sp. AOG1]GFE58962.1 hypothetical protein AOG1_28420 [Geobacter sp. AOG1]